MSDKPTVVEALCAVMGEVNSIAKGRRNEQQGYKFRGIDEAMAAFHPALVKHGVVIAPEVVERLAETRTTAKGGGMNVVHLRVRFTFYGPAGDSITCVTQGEAQDSADKATNKAMSAAFKYALFFVFCVPTEEQDADSTTIDASPAPRYDGDPWGTPAPMDPSAVDGWVAQWRADLKTASKSRMSTLAVEISRASREGQIDEATTEALRIEHAHRQAELSASKATNEVAS